MKIKKLFILGISTLLLTGCFFKRDSMENIDIYTTIYPINYLTTYLYGDYSKVHSIYPSGVNINEFNLSDKKISEYSKSDLFIFNGQDKDRDYAVSMINKNNNLKIIDTSLSITYDYSVTELWINPNNYLMMAQNIKNGLNEYISDPYINKEIDKKYEELNKSLSKLDAYLKETLKDAEYNTIVTDSDELRFLENLLTDKSFTVISLDKTDEVNITYTVKDGDTLDTIAKENNITKDSIIKLNNLENGKITTGQKLDLTIKIVSNNNIAKAKKLIADKKIKYIYTTSDTNSEIVKELTNDYDIEIIKLINMSTIDGGVTNTNENYLTIMNSNIELLRKELYK